MENKKFKNENITPKGFTIVDNSIFDIENLSTAAKLLFISLIRFYNRKEGFSYPSQISLLKSCGIKDKRTLQKATKELEEKGYIIKECKKGKPNKYYINPNYMSYSIGDKVGTKNVGTENVGTNIVSKVDTKNVGTVGTKNVPQQILYTNTNTSTNKTDDKSSDTPSKKDTYNSEIKEIVDYLNLKADKNFKVSTKSTRKGISRRLNEGYTVNDFKQVIDLKAKEWKGTKWEKYLSPDTLFNPTKFEKYINEIPNNEPKEEYKGKAMSLDDIKKTMM